MDPVAVSRQPVPRIGTACDPEVSQVHLISATFVDHDEARLAIAELCDGLGIQVDGVATLAEVDPPLANPVLVAAHVSDETERAARDVLVAHGGAVVSRPERLDAAGTEPTAIPIAEHLSPIDSF
jgi:hypothetical protein